MDNLIICKRCVMDNKSDTTITFDKEGYCNYCTEAINSMPSRYFPNEEGRKKLESLIDRLKDEGKGKKYDCLMGISGGLDSSYLAYKGYKHGLRILAIHVDDGFNSEIAIRNINKIEKACNLDIVHVKPDREQYYDLTKAFFKAGVPNLAIPQDNLIFSYLYEYATKYNVKNFLSGGNFALESILQRGNTHSASDKKHIIDINKKFGTTSINKLRITSSFERKIKGQYILRINETYPLNYIDYNKEMAIKELSEACDYNYYGGKHYESILTTFMQKYYLPKKFKVDKRKSHLSSLVIVDQMSRDEALEELKKPLYSDSEIDEIIKEFINKIDISMADFNSIMSSKPKEHTDYATSYWKYISTIVRKIRRY